MNYDFAERLEFSQGQRGKRDAEILKKAIRDCVNVRKTDTETDKRGIDYIATLKGGAEIGIDVKARDKGISKYWKNGKEDLVLEVWSVYPDEQNWTLSDRTNVDLILYTFDEADSKNYYLLPYQLLRMAFWNNGKKWVGKYGVRYSHSGSWSTQVVFVPAVEVIEAIKAEMQRTFSAEDEDGEKQNGSSNRERR